MGDAADDAWDAALEAQMEFTMLVQNIRENCERGRCRIVTSDYDENENNEVWLPYRCASCGEEFDY